MAATRLSLRTLTASIMLVMLLSFAGSVLLCAEQAHAATPARPSIASVKSTAAGKLSIKINAAKGAKGYQYVASTSKRFDSGSTYYLESSTVAKTSVTFSNLKEGKTYYVRARAYGKKKSYGKWSLVKSATVKASDALSNAKAETQVYKKKYETAAAEANKLKIERDAAGSQVAQLKKECEAAKVEIAQYKSECDAAKLELAGYKEELKAAQAESVKYKSELDSATAEIVQLKQQVSALTPAKITYDTDGGKLPEGVKTAVYAEDGRYTLPAPTRFRFDFEGWYDSAGNRVTTISQSDGDVSLKAKWMEIKYAYVYVDAGNRTDEAAVWDDDTQSYVGNKLYELYIMSGAEAPEVGSQYDGGTVVFASSKPDGKTYPANSVALLVEAPYESLSLPSLKECATVDLHMMDVSNVTSVDSMFSDCSKLLTLNISGWDANNVTNVGSMLSDCVSLETLDITGFKLPRNSSNMFSGLSKLRELKGIEGWETVKVTSMAQLFDGCSSLTSLDLSSWDVRNLTDVNSMFRGCSSLESLNVAGWNVDSATDASNMFSGCSSLASIDVTDFVPPSNCSRLFSGLNKLKELNGISSWNTSNVTNMAFMFSGCSSLPSLDILNWDVRNVSSTERMFASCSSLDSLDLHDWNTQSMEDLEYMFINCTSLTALNLSGWNTSSVWNMGWMFYGDTMLTSLNFSGWDTNKVTNMGRLFFCCSSIEYLDLSDWATSNVSDMNDMFDGCISLVRLDTGAGWVTSRYSSYRPEFPKTMYDESGNKFLDINCIPDGEHTYTDTNPLQVNSLKPTSMLEG